MFPENLCPEEKLIRSTLLGQPLGILNLVSGSVMADIADREGVSGILYRALPETFRSFVERSYYAAAATSLLVIRILNEIETELCREHTEVLTLKGASLIETAYPDVGMRGMTDVDLMVRPERMEHLIAVLRRMGFEPNPYAPHLFHKDGIDIDLHTDALNTDRILARQPLFRAGMEPVWQNSIPYSPGFRRLRRPDDVDNVLLLCQHAMKHSYSKYIWLEDIRRLLTDRDSEFLIRLRRRAALLEQEKSLAMALYLLNGIFQFRLPSGFGYELMTAELSGVETSVLDIRIKGGRLGLLGNLLMLCCITGLRERFRFAQETLFPRAEVLRNDYQLTADPASTFIYAKRILQVLTFLVGHGAIVFSALTHRRRSDSKPF